MPLLKSNKNIIVYRRCKKWDGGNANNTTVNVHQQALSVVYASFVSIVVSLGLAASLVGFVAEDLLRSSSEDCSESDGLSTFPR